MHRFVKKVFPVCCDGEDEATQPSRFSFQKPAPSSNTRNDSDQSTRQDWISKDDYVEIKELNSGSQGRTSLTRSKTTNAVFVVKHYTKYISHFYGHRNMAIDKHNRLPDEAMVLLNALDAHPNVVRAFGADYWPVHNCCLYLEYCSGGDLADQLNVFSRQRRQSPEVFVLHVFVSLAQALTYLHHGLVWDDNQRQYWQKPGHLSLVHGDVKCENIFLRWSDNPERPGLPDVVLGDFGGAALTAHAVGITGTQGYEAPEVHAVFDFESRDIERNRAANAMVGVMTPATDVYSLGQVMIRSITRRFHVCGGDPTTQPPRRSGRETVGIHVPEEYQETGALTMAVQWCLMVNPEMRPDMSTKEGMGVADLVGHLCGERDKILRTKAPLKVQIWASHPQLGR